MSRDPGGPQGLDSSVVRSGGPSTQASFAGSGTAVAPPGLSPGFRGGGRGGKTKLKTVQLLSQLFLSGKQTIESPAAPTHWPHGPSLIGENMGSRVYFSRHIATPNRGVLGRK